MTTIIYRNMTFKAPVIRLKLHFALENRTETIDYGTYTVVTPEAYGSVVTIDAVDDHVQGRCTLYIQLEFSSGIRRSCAGTLAQLWELLWQLRPFKKR